MLEKTWDSIHTAAIIYGKVEAGLKEGGQVYWDACDLLSEVDDDRENWNYDGSYTTSDGCEIYIRDIIEMAGAGEL